MRGRGRRIRAPGGIGFQRAWEFAVSNSLLMVSGALLALLWANTNLAAYETVAHSLHFVVNDIAMAFFFGLATKEIVEATAPGGARPAATRWPRDGGPGASRSAPPGRRGDRS